MLSIYYGDMPQAIYNPVVFFKNTYTDDWITDDLSRAMIQDVDKSTVLGPRIIDSPVFGGISPRELSGGVKTLIAIYKVPDRIFNASACGDNCAKWILKIGELQNITILKGDSATGKTTLVEMVSEFYESGTDSGIDLRCDRPCRTLGGKDWHMILTSLHETIVFIDEDNAFLPTNEFAEAVRNSDNYYILVTREGLANLPYSVEEIYGIRHSGKYAGLKPIYNEFYHIYNQTDSLKPVHPERMIVEDSHTGYEFFKELSAEKK
ncbi:MAG: DUF4869 domain-containing protein [Clostridiales bacterium]|nr:DUF4869 domain-containing protein [Clostridiales bacterium]